jgi:CelD/BcsL family acetyltransferase involved in cellulose biosynthesis
VATRVGEPDVITSLASAEAVEPEWDALAERFGRTPFALPALALSWWRHLGHGELMVITVRGRSGELLCVAPLHRRALPGLRVARWLGTGLGSVSELVMRPDCAPAATAVWNVLGQHVQALDLLEYRHDGFGLLELRRSARWSSRLRIADLSPTLQLETTWTMGDLLAGRSNLRKKLAHYDRAVAATGQSFQVEMITRPERVAEVVPDMIAIDDKADRAHPRARLLSGRWQPFMLDALRVAAHRGQLVVFLGRLGRRPVAFDIAVRVGATLATWTGGYDPGVAHLAPGHLLMREIARWGLDHDIATIDLLIGDAEYKRRWSTSSYDTVDVVAGDPRRRRSPAALVDVAHAIHPLKQRMRPRRLSRPEQRT